MALMRRLQALQAFGGVVRDPARAGNHRGDRRRQTLDPGIDAPALAGVTEPEVRSLRGALATACDRRERR